MKIQNIIFSLVLLFGFSIQLFAESLMPNSVSSVRTCVKNLKIQKQRSEELHELVTADQKERENWNSKTPEELKQLNEHDLYRRNRVRELWDEGCFKTAEDYSAASLIFQHGERSNHYYQAFIWANRAVELGDLSQKSLIALTIDRYLISIGKKQLFGSQAYAENAHKSCYCLQPTELSFPDEKRLEYTNLRLQDRYNWIASINSDKCQTHECLTKLKATLLGSISGFW